MSTNPKGRLKILSFLIIIELNSPPMCKVIKKYLSKIITKHILQINYHK